MNPTEIQKHLHQKHYLNVTTPSEVYSSHWTQWSRENDVQVSARDNLSFKIRGLGFGDFIPVSPINNIRYGVQTLLLKNYLKKYTSLPRVRMAAKEISKKTERILSFDCCKHIVVLERILKEIGSPNTNTTNPFSKMGINSVCVIGDGFGFMGSLIKKIDPAIQVIFVNLGRQLLYDVHFCHRALGDKYNYELLRRSDSQNNEVDFYFLDAEDYQKIGSLEVNLFINIASMQEMNMTVISNYFRYMRESRAVTGKSFFYCCNRIEKKLPGGEISNFDKFPWEDSKILHESIPPWYQKYPSNTPPFWRPFDGPSKERLVEL